MPSGRQPVAASPARRKHDSRSEGLPGGARRCWHLRGLASAATGAMGSSIRRSSKLTATRRGSRRRNAAAIGRSGKPFVYTSGVWVHGNTGGKVAGESSPLNPPAIVAWRPAVERLVLDAAGKNVRTAVIRPAMVYGRGGGVLAGFVQSSRQTGRVRIVGDGENRWTFVHVDDLADLYVRALERSPAGEVYLAASGPALRVGEVAAAAGAGGEVQTWRSRKRAQGARFARGRLRAGSAGSQHQGARLLGWVPGPFGARGTGRRLVCRCRA
jgi:nucleoside-diphosphate-sugar epimerase